MPVPGVGSASQGRSSTPTPRSVSKDGMADIRVQVDALAVATLHADLGASRGPGNRARDAARDSQGHPHSCDDGRSPLPVPSESPTSRGNDRSSGHVHGGSGPPHAGGAATLRCIHEAHGERISPTSGIADAQASVATLGACEHAPAVLAKVRSLRLNNPHNLCYANSLSLAWIWLSGLDPGEPEGHFGGNAQALRTLLEISTSSINLLQILAWQPIWRGWPNPHLQQDAQEFFAHLQAASMKLQIWAPLPKAFRYLSPNTLIHWITALSRGVYKPISMR